MKTLFAIITLAALSIAANASEIIRGSTLTDGQQLYSSDLHGLIDNSTIGVQFYNDQQTTPSLSSGYYFLVLDPANQVFRRITAQTALYGNTNIYLNLPSKTVPVYGSLMFFDPTNGWIGTTTFSNLFNGLSGSINVSGLKYATTNNAGATNKYVLPVWPNAFSGLNTNYPLNLMVFDTNGTSYQYALSNTETAFYSDAITSQVYFAANYNELFQPWTVYGTNTYGFTNAWGFQTNFPITSLYLTNSYPASTNTAELVDADTVPINSTQQQTNTAATLGSIYQYLAAKNTLPAYTAARIQFAGTAAQVTVSNAADNVNGLVRIQTNFFTGGSIYAVSFSTNLINASITTNQVYYVVPQVTNNTWLHIYTNYSTAQAGTGYLSVSSQNVGTGDSLFYLTNYTSYNCDITQAITPPATIRPGFYDLWFRTNSATPYYYVSGSAMNETADNNMQIVGLANDNLISTNRVRIMVREYNAYNGGGTTYCSPLIHVLIQPQ